MRRRHIVLKGRGNLHVSRKQDACYLVIKEDLSKFYIVVSLWQKKRKSRKLFRENKINKSWIYTAKVKTRKYDSTFFANSQGNIRFHCFVLNVIDSIVYIFLSVFNSQGNTKCFVFQSNIRHYNENLLWLLVW